MGKKAVDSELFSLDAEKSALGSMILSATALSLVFERGIDEDDFHREAHAAIYSALACLYAAGSPVDLVTLRDELVGLGRLESSGGVEYLMHIAEFVPSAANADSYAHTVRDLSLRRSGVRQREREILQLKDLEKPCLNGTWGKRDMLHGQQFGSDFTPVVLEHLIEPYLVKGKPHLWDADGGTQKTSFLVYTAAMLSRGRNPITGEECEVVRTLYIHKGEDSNEELETVFRANGGDTTKISWINDMGFVLDEKGFERWGNTIVDFKAGLSTFDALFYFLPAELKNANDNLPAMKIMTPMLKVCAETNCTEVSLRHTSKGKLGKEASELGMGSQQFRNSHRGQLVARYDPEDESDNKRIIVTDEKGSLLNKRGKPFAFRREGLEIQMIREEIVNPFIGADEEAYRKRDKRKASPVRDRCKEWIEHYMAGAACRRDAIVERARDAGFQERMVAWALSEMDLSTKNEPKQGRGRPHAWFAPFDYDWSGWVPAQPELEEIPPPTDADAPQDIPEVDGDYEPVFD